MKQIPTKTIILLLALLVLLLSSGTLLSLYVNSLWFKEIQYYSVFLKILVNKVLLGLVHAAAFFAILYPNLRFAHGYDSRLRDMQLEQDPLGPFWKPILLIGSILLALVLGFQGAGTWETYQLFLHGSPFDLQDPIFNKDLGFYVFTLPFISYIQKWLSSTLVMSLLFCGLMYFYRQAIRIDPKGLFIDRQPRLHLFALGGLYLFLLAWAYYLDRYHLLYSQRGVVFGAVYADVHIKLPALWVLSATALFSGGLLIFAGLRRGWLLPGLAAGAVLLVHVVGGSVLPDLVHRFQVLPNEIALESPYIQHNIQATRLAFGLHRTESEPFPASEDLTREDLQKNVLTTQNIRLWDHRPLLATYRQLQQIRTYYDFVDVDNDRYLIDGEYRQVMLSPRELSYNNLPSRIWINEHLTYTHGHGVTLGPVSRISKEGLPEFFIKDIPPVASTDIQITRPEIYYGEIPNDYVFVKTRALEFDYPSGEENIYTDYLGEGGVPMNSLLRKLAFSAYFGSLKIFLSNDMTPESRIMYDRSIIQRAKKIAPFLSFDGDPYMVITEDGRLIWLLDGYTTTDKFPYSQPFSGVGNYIRNSVKVTVDAYHGSVHFYVSDPEDPIIRSYEAIFPGLFSPLAEMPQDLRTHIRYPQDFFRIQAQMYTTYHMQDPQLFYNKEDLWDIPAKDNRQMEPYYTIMKLPGEEKEEFILLLPFTPAKRDNLSAWLAGRSDGENYGKLIVYTFPKQKLVFGPRQIENRIDQDAYISQQLTLWGQSGSEVIRGSLLVIPIEDSLLYVSPLYLASSAEGALPELRRVIAGFGSKLVMEENLEKALDQLFGSEPVTPQAVARELSKTGQPPEKLAASALSLYRRSQTALREGRWGEYGEALGELEVVLQELANRARKE